ncbi:MAG: hypothetical protein HYY31_05460 [Chloroflexi bacterium]|nr:hypothetical protein [Chloroflexota bacterium]
MLSLGWFSTGRGEGSRGLLRYVMEAIQRGELDARILFVFCNRAPGQHPGSDQFIALARGYGLPVITFSTLQFRRENGGAPISAIRAEHDQEILHRLDGFQPDLCVMAGYMLISSPKLHNRYTMVNLHPAIPGGPTGTWQDIIWHQIRTRTSEAGAMVHLVTEELDQGPAITYCSYPIVGVAFDNLWRQVHGRTIEELRGSFGEDLPIFQAIRQEGLKRERPLLLETLKALAQGHIRIVQRRVLDAQGNPVPPLLLNSSIARLLAPAER